MDPEILSHSGFVSLIGRPNVGKSTLLNQLAGQRLAITSPKPQTTRSIIRAIIDEPDTQIVFLDTPGLHLAKSKLGQYMTDAARLAMADTDIILLLIEAGFSPRVLDIERKVLAQLQASKKPVILVINKVDSNEKESILPLMAAFHEVYPFQAIIPISAKTGDGISILIDEIRRLLPEGPRYFPIDSLTDQTERMIAGELIREQILLKTHEEIPHGTAVVVDSFTEHTTEAGERTHVTIEASIVCEKDTHKGILIGKQGSMLTAIGTGARKEIEAMLDCPCYLDLFVRVRDDWRNRQSILNDLGYQD
ncbi:MAG: GTPase Era [Eubacteriales bacterium]|nr:GTPase Era [Eubacteriales bacterium]